MVPPQLRPHLSLLLFDRANPSPNPLSFSSPLGERFPQTWSAPSGPFLSLTLSLSLSPSFPFSLRLSSAFPSILGSICLSTHPCAPRRSEGVGRLAGCSPDCLPDCKSAGPPASSSSPRHPRPPPPSPLCSSILESLSLLYPLRTPLPFLLSLSLSRFGSLLLVSVARAPDIIRFEIKLPRHARHPNNASGCLKQ